MYDDDTLHGVVLCHAVCECAFTHSLVTAHAIRRQLGASTLAIDDVLLTESSELKFIYSNIKVYFWEILDGFLAAMHAAISEGT